MWQKIKNEPPKKMIFYYKILEWRCLTIVISWTCDKVNLNQSNMWIDWRSFILFGKFNLITCNVCKALIKGCHNLSIDVKVAKNVGGPNCQIIANKFFLNLSK